MRWLSRRCCDFIFPFLLNRSDRRRKVSGGHLLCADRSGTETLELRAPDGALSTKKDILFGCPFFVEQERQTGLEPAVSTLARSRVTNYATIAFIKFAVPHVSSTIYIIQYRIRSVNIFLLIFPKKIFIKYYHSHFLIKIML